MIIPLSKKSVAAAVCSPGESSTVYSFRESPWLKLRVSSVGLRSWLYLRRNLGKIEKRVLGRIETHSPQEALELAISIASGKDAAPERRRTISEIWTAWFEREGINTASPEKTIVYYRKLMAPFEKMDLRDLTPQRLVAWHAAMTTQNGPVAANRALRHLRAVWSWALDNQLTTAKNLCSELKENHEEPRDRFLYGDELNKFTAAVESLPPRLHNFQDFLGIVMRTGARMGNICSMEWSEIDFDACEWRIPADKFKARRTHTIPLVPAAVEILIRRRNKQMPVSRWVFPSGTDHVKTFICSLRRMCAKAGIANLHQHDLRRTVASILLNDGVPLETVMAILGHNDPETTKIYARIADKTKRSALERLR